MSRCAVLGDDDPKMNWVTKFYSVSVLGTEVL